MIEIILAFSAGLISFLSPCVLPLIPGYISFVSGQSLQELLTKKEINLFPLILFCFGFSTVFITFGATASFLGQILLQNSQALRIFAGIIIIVFSLQLIGVINISYLNFEKRLEAKKTQNFIFPYIIGLAFGFGWTPCIGPILGSILALAAIEETLAKAIDKSSQTFDQVVAKIIPKSGFVISGGKFEADILLVAYDSKQSNDVVVNGNTIKPVGGVAKYEATTAGEGTQTVKGYIDFQGKDGAQQLPFETQYTVFKGAATISADAMNVMYIGLDNPVSISDYIPELTIIGSSVSKDYGCGGYRVGWLG